MSRWKTCRVTNFWMEENNSKRNGELPLRPPGFEKCENPQKYAPAVAIRTFLKNYRVDGTLVNFPLYSENGTHCVPNYKNVIIMYGRERRQP